MQNLKSFSSLFAKPLLELTVRAVHNLSIYYHHCKANCSLFTIGKLYFTKNTACHRHRPTFCCFVSPRTSADWYHSKLPTRVGQLFTNNFYPSFIPPLNPNHSHHQSCSLPSPIFPDLTTLQSLLQVRNLGREWAFEVGIVDHTGRVGTDRLSTFQVKLFFF